MSESRERDIQLGTSCLLSTKRTETENKLF